MVLILHSKCIGKKISKKPNEMIAYVDRKSVIYTCTLALNLFMMIINMYTVARRIINGVIVSKSLKCIKYNIIETGTYKSIPRWVIGLASDMLS